MGTINMFQSSLLGIEALTILLVGEKHQQALETSQVREKTTSIPKHRFLGVNSMNKSSNQHRIVSIYFKYVTIIY
jgi:hypothetical protein